MSIWLPDSAINGLYIRKGKTNDSYVVKAKQRGYRVPVTVTLGKTSVLSLKAARVLAKEALFQLSQGVNPNEARREAKIIKETKKAEAAARSLTLREAKLSYRSLKKRKEKTVVDMERTIERRFHDWLDKPLQEISREMVLQRFQKIMHDVRKDKEARRSKRAAQGLNNHIFNSEDGRGEAQRAFRYFSAIIESVKDDVVAGKRLLESNP